MNKNRPIHIDLRLIKLPLPGLVSILHRVSGLLLFLTLPLFLKMLQYSLFSIETYTQLVATLRHPLSRLILIGLLWAFLHHLCAGIRYLAVDMHIGVGLTQARASSKLVLFVSLGLTLLIGVWIW
ncbi:Succinate dehydrogenase cytochrome b-556 subunit [Candidatus Nitrotoga sp. HW29]|uniref:succinate dehydrogenase, cytochrome b556 subunit n=1 Tax=Candidatus Nitrotoga sp. HW29 TaxID=2886963 RepID=UPI001EF2A27E|nr:succinate dehydrogenase, cytochrome b556 subunit [Candidatus Nitrotoga sp. HW29]CAH1903721.1 Succinate dehydrogenase cytochrome b-556 subunit [Candidatus Nitrotoga sp. HW29]